jgi:hypothetical protein
MAVVLHHQLPSLRQRCKAQLRNLTAARMTTIRQPSQKPSQLLHRIPGEMMTPRKTISWQLNLTPSQLRSQTRR